MICKFIHSISEEGLFLEFYRINVLTTSFFFSEINSLKYPVEYYIVSSKGGVSDRLVVHLGEGGGKVGMVEKW